MDIQIDYKKQNGLVPAIIQDIISKDIYMLGYMNEQAVKKTIESGKVFFWSRSRKRLWMKGEESGNILKVVGIKIDCDYDTLLISVQLLGKNVCHTGKCTCFNKELLINNI